MRPALASQRKTGGSGQARASSATAASSGTTRGTFSTSPPPVMCAIALARPARANARHDRT
jgi:hypothetical protein